LCILCIYLFSPRFIKFLAIFRPDDETGDVALELALGVLALDELALGEPALGELALGEPALDEPALGEPALGEPALGELALGVLAFSRKGSIFALPLVRDGLADLTDLRTFLQFSRTAAEVLDFPVVIREGLILELRIAPHIQYYQILSDDI
jgi:hypothetical protein